MCFNKKTSGECKMSLKFKAKTLARLNIAHCRELERICKNCVANCEFEGTPTYKGKFLTLKEAQKEIGKREQEFQEVQNDAYETINRLTDVNRKLDAKIVEALKIIDEQKGVVPYEILLERLCVVLNEVVK
jgi:ferredoxin